MNATENDNKFQQLSAFADGELAADQIDEMMALLRRSEQQTCWDRYHQIGDVIRSDELALTPSMGFSTKMAARLEMEPSYLAPNTVTSVGARNSVQLQPFAWMRALSSRSSIAAGLAAGALLLLFNTARLHSDLLPAASTFAQKNTGTEMTVPPQLAGVMNAQEAKSSVPPIVVLRDSRIDEYLLAHQRFSPSLYSTAQFARSASFAAASEK